jgi:hypothetical protein
MCMEVYLYAQQGVRLRTHTLMNKHRLLTIVTAHGVSLSIIQPANLFCMKNNQAGRKKRCHASAASFPTIYNHKTNSLKNQVKHSWL